MGSRPGSPPPENLTRSGAARVLPVAAIVAAAGLVAFLILRDERSGTAPRPPANSTQTRERADLAPPEVVELEAGTGARAEREALPVDSRAESSAFEGLVVDVYSRAPIPDVGVAAWREEAWVEVTRTDAEGRFTVPRRSGLYFEREDYYGLFADEAEQERSAGVYELYPRGTLRITTVTPEGVPVPRVGLAIDADGLQSSGRRAEGWVEFNEGVLTDETGQLELGWMPCGMRLRTKVLDGRAGESWEGEIPVGTAWAEALITVEGGCLVRGLVLAEDGGPVGGTCVRLVQPIGYPVSGSTETDARGGYEFHSVPPGVYEVRVTATGVDKPQIEVPVAGIVEVPPIQIPTLGELSGHVLMRPASVPRLLFMQFSQDGEVVEFLNEGRWSLQLELQPDGRFQVLLPLGRTLLSVIAAKDWASHEVFRAQVTVPTVGLELDLEAQRGRIRGLLEAGTMPDRAPLQAHLRPLDVPDAIAIERRTQVLSGAFIVPDLPPGRYEVVVELGGVDATGPVQCAVAAGQETVVGPLRVADEALTVLVRNEQGLVKGGGAILVETPDGKPHSSRIASDGRTFLHLPAGSYSIWAKLDSGRFSTRLETSTGSWQQAVIELQVGSPGRVDGILGDRQGRPVPGGMVLLLEVASDGKLEQETDSQGVFAFPAVEPGNYDVVYGRDPRHLVSAARLDLGPGERRELDLELDPAVMRIRLTRDGEPIPGISFGWALSSTTPVQRYPARVDATGVIELQCFEGPFVFLGVVSGGPVGQEILGAVCERAPDVAEQVVEVAVEGVALIVPAESLEELVRRPMLFYRTVSGVPVGHRFARGLVHSTFVESGGLVFPDLPKGSTVTLEWRDTSGVRRQRDIEIGEPNELVIDL